MFYQRFQLKKDVDGFHACSMGNLANTELNILHHALKVVWNY